jgi:DNA-binding CsgD family transcriptional regulator
LGATESLLRVALTLPRLTAREARVLELVAAGLTTGQIGGLLTVSAKDVEYHVGHLLQKFESRNRTGLVARAYALGYLEQLTWPPVARAPNWEAFARSQKGLDEKNG